MFKFDLGEMRTRDLIRLYVMSVVPIDCSVRRDNSILFFYSDPDGCGNGTYFWNLVQL